MAVEKFGTVCKLYHQTHFNINGRNYDAKTRKRSVKSKFSWILQYPKLSKSEEYYIVFENRNNRRGFGGCAHFGSKYAIWWTCSKILFEFVRYMWSAVSVRVPSPANFMIAKCLFPFFLLARKSVFEFNIKRNLKQEPWIVKVQPEKICKTLNWRQVKYVTRT